MSTSVKDLILKEFPSTPELKPRTSDKRPIRTVPYRKNDPFVPFTPDRPELKSSPAAATGGEFPNLVTVNNRSGFILSQPRTHFSRRASISSKSSTASGRKSALTGKPDLLNRAAILRLTHAETTADVWALNMDDCGFTEVDDTDFATLENLREITANQNRLRMHHFRNLPNVKSLSLSCNGIVDIVDIHGHFQNLETLDLSFNRIRNAALSWLATLPNLRMLNLMHNEISTFPDTVLDLKFSAVESQYFRKVGIPLNMLPFHRERSGQCGFPRLEVLNLENNQLTSTDSETLLTLSKLPKLKQLNLDRNRITSLDVFRPHTDNYLFTRQFDGFHQLLEFHIADNAIPTRNDFIGITGLPVLKRIWIQGNPFIKKLVLENRVKEFSEMIADLQEIQNIKVEDVNYGKNHSKEERGLVYISALLRRRHRRKEQRQDGSDKKAASELRTVDEHLPKSPERLTDTKIAEILRQNRAPLRSAIHEKDGRGTASKRSPGTAVSFAPGTGGGDNLQSAHELLPSERVAWEIAGAHVDGDRATTARTSTSGSSSRYVPTPAIPGSDATFLTGVNIQNSPAPKEFEEKIFGYSRRNFHHALNRDLNFADGNVDQFNLELPVSLQGTLKALRRAIHRPEVYWRLAEKSFPRDTLNTMIRKDVMMREQKTKQLPFQEMNLANLHKNNCSLKDVRVLMDKFSERIDDVDQRISAISGSSSWRNSHPAIAANVTETRKQLDELQGLLLQASESSPTSAK